MQANDAKLHTVDGIADALAETCGELGISIEYGWVCLGRVYRPSSREILVGMDMADVRKAPGLIELWGTITVNENDVRDFLCADAEKHLKPGTRYEVRKKYPNNYGRTHGMAWYRNDAMDNRERWGEVPREPKACSGYLMVGEFVTPKPEGASR